MRKSLVLQKKKKNYHKKKERGKKKRIHSGQTLIARIAFCKRDPHLFQSQSSKGFFFVCLFFLDIRWKWNSLCRRPAKPAREMQQKALRVKKSIANLKKNQKIRQQSVRNHPDENKPSKGWMEEKEGFPPPSSKYSQGGRRPEVTGRDKVLISLWPFQCSNSAKLHSDEAREQTYTHSFCFVCSKCLCVCLFVFLR